MQHKILVHVSVFEIVGSGHSRKQLGHFHKQIELK